MSQQGTQFCQLTADLLAQSMKKIEHCLLQLDDSQFWWRPEPSMNSVGNLLLHLAGNLCQWGIVPLTGKADRRERESEFLDQSIDRQLVIQRLRSTVLEAKEAWPLVTADQITTLAIIQGFEVTIMNALLHTSSHFVGHTHQVIQLTRMQLKDRYQFQWKPDDDRGSVPI